MNRQNEKQEIAQLLSKFMAGETTLNEEQTLTTYFRSHEVDEEWKEYKEMFALFDNGQVDIETRSAAAKPKIHFVRWFMAGIAASIILLLGISVLMKDGKTNEKTPDIAQQSIKQNEPQPVHRPVVEEKEEEVLAEVQPAAQPVKKRKEIGRKQSAPIEEPVPTEAEPMFTEEPVPSYNPTIQDPFLLAAEFAQEIRSHGERLDRKIAQMMIK